VRIINPGTSTIFISDIKARLGAKAELPIPITSLLSSNNLIQAIITDLVDVELNDDEKKLPEIGTILSYIQVEKQKRFGSILAERIFDTIHKKKPISDDIPIRPVNFIAAGDNT